MADAHPAVRVLTGLVTTAACVVSGAVSGIVFVKLFVPRRGMGWDQIADALGGLMLGALLGLAVGVFLAIRLTPRRQLAAIAVAAAAFGGCWLFLYLTRGDPRSAGLPGSSQESDPGAGTRRGRICRGEATSPARISTSVTALCGTRSSSGNDSRPVTPSNPTPTRVPAGSGVSPAESTGRS